MREIKAFTKAKATLTAKDTAREDAKEKAGEAQQTCKFGHSNRGTTRGSEALHHSCGCAVLRGEDK